MSGRRISNSYGSLRDAGNGQFFDGLAARDSARIAAEQHGSRFSGAPPPLRTAGSPAGTSYCDSTWLTSS